MLQHHPHRFDIISGKSPVTLRLEVAEIEILLQSDLNPRERASDLARHKRFAPSRRFVVEQHAVRKMQAVGFAIVHNVPVRRNLAHRVGTARVKGGALVLRRLGGSEHLRRTGLVHAHRVSGNAVVMHRFEQAQRACGYNVGGVFRLVEAHADVRLRRQVVDFMRGREFQYAAKASTVGDVAIVERQLNALVMRVGVDVVQALGVKRGCPAHDSVHLVALVYQKFRQIRAVLARNACNKRPSRRGFP